MTLGKAKIFWRLTCNGLVHGTPRPQTDRTCGLVLGSCHVGPQGPLSIPLSTPEKGLLEYLILLNSAKIFVYVCIYWYVYLLNMVKKDMSHLLGLSPFTNVVSTCTPWYLHVVRKEEACGGERGQCLTWRPDGKQLWPRNLEIGPMWSGDELGFWSLSSNPQTYVVWAVCPWSIHWTSLSPGFLTWGEPVWHQMAIWT